MKPDTAVVVPEVVADDSKGSKPRTGCNGRGCEPNSGRGNSEGNEQSAQDGD